MPRGDTIGTEAIGTGKTIVVVVRIESEKEWKSERMQQLVQVTYNSTYSDVETMGHGLGVA